METLNLSWINLFHDLTKSGVVDKFIGDAVMAVYGTPTSVGIKEDAWRAVLTAYEMRLKLAELHQGWATRGLAPLKFGIGLNHGEVFCGNIGSPKRMEYTVIGDPVNVASRVEGLNKDFGTDILLTESVYALVKDRVEVTPMNATAVKGRGEKVVVYFLKSIPGHDGANSRDGEEISGKPSPKPTLTS